MSLTALQFAAFGTPEGRHNNTPILLVDPHRQRPYLFRTLLAQDKGPLPFAVRTMHFLIFFHHVSLYCITLIPGTKTCSLGFLLAALRADSVQIMGMPQQLEAVLVGNPGLQSFNTVAVKLHSPAALLTNQMIVMSLGGYRLKTGSPIPKLQLESKISFAKQLERTVYRCLPDARITLADDAIKLLQSMMSRKSKKDIGNSQPLPGHVHSLIAHILQKLVLIIHAPSRAFGQTFHQSGHA